MIFGFLLFLTFFAMVGLSSAFHSRGTKKDYYLASSSVAPSLVGLSAVATNNSGYMFIGVIGYTYVTGLAAIWLMVGWIAGDLLAASLVHKRLRAATERTGEVSFAGVLAGWHDVGERLPVQRLAAVITLIFLMAYAGAQLVAGSKALHVLFGWPDWAGAVIGAVLVAAYCLAGGIRASIWTDAAQSVVMILAMGLLLFVATQAVGGIGGAVAEMRSVEGFLNWFPKDTLLPGFSGGVLFAISWGFAGLSVAGQPHVMVRFMTLSDNSQMLRAKLWYYLWFIAFYLMATGVGLLSRIHLPDAGAFDAELALPMMALELLPPFLVGLILAGVFAATMSTADSVVLSCSSALTHDLLPQNIESTRMLKAATGLITLLALMWALFNEQSVFSLVIMAWSGLASALAPLLLFLCFGGRPGRRISITAMLAGLATALVWRWIGWHGMIYEGMPGILIGLLVLSAPGLMHRLKRKAS